MWYEYLVNSAPHHANNVMGTPIVFELVGKILNTPKVFIKRNKI